MKGGHFLTAMLMLTICAMISCPGANNDPPPNDGPSDPAAFAVPYDLHPLRAALPSGFIRGADISNCWQIEQYGGKYRNFDSQPEDIMKILTDNGINHVRIRLWVDPDKHWGRYAGDGNNNLAVVAAIAARAKDAGMKFLLNYHYSDYWADPRHQDIPWRWKDLDRQKLLDAVYGYTKETIAELIEAGAEPDMVQLGNEISGGLLSKYADYGYSDGTNGSGYVLKDWQDYSDALQYAARAVREAAPNAKIMVHIGEGGSGELLNIFANFTGLADNSGPVYTQVDYDIIGLSWYSFWPSHQSIDSLYSNIRNLKQMFGKDVVVCETGYLWSDENWDDMGNYMGMFQENNAANLLTNANGFASDSGAAFACRPDGTTKYFPASGENQARMIRATMDAVAAAGGAGVMWWGADWFAPVQGLASNAENGALFDNIGMALPAMKVLGGIKGADAAKPGKITGLKAAAAGAAVNLSWDTVNAAIASKYELERAAAADGTWASLDDKLAGGSFTDTGLLEEADYYYRVRAWNINGWGNYSDTVQITTAAFAFETPAGLRVSAATADSISLVWNTVIGAALYKIYGAQAAAEPADTAYALLSDISSGTAYTHTGLNAGSTWWYKASAVYIPQGEGPKGAAISATAGAEVDLKASISMTSAALDIDFLDTLKASSSTDYLPVPKPDSSNYEIRALYAANDSDYLYVALDYGFVRPAMWQYDWITVWIDNVNSEAGGASTNNGNFRIAHNQTISPAATIEASISHNRNALAGTSAAKNTTWNNVDNLYSPGADDFVIKYCIPLSGIGGAVKGNELKILASGTQGWNSGNDPRVGGLIPAAAVNGAVADSGIVTVDMGKALSYIVK